MQPHLKPRGRAAALLALSLLSLSGCSDAPELPAVPVEVVALAARYDAPTASLDSDDAVEIIEYTRELREQLQVLSGLQFVGDVIGDAASATAKNQDASGGLRGSITARTLCPGVEAASSETSAADEAQRGSIQFTIGIENSQIQRAFSGRMERCRFQVAARTLATVTADLQVDLGGRLSLAQPSRSDLLIRATNVQVSDLDEDREGFQVDLIHLRLTSDSAVQALIELDALGIGLVGTVLLELADDGSVAVRGRDGAWRCGGDGCAASS